MGEGGGKKIIYPVDSQGPGKRGSSEPAPTNRLVCGSVEKLLTAPESTVTDSARLLEP